MGVYLLYADESGDLSDPHANVFVVGGVAVHEDAVRPLAGAINERMNRFVGKRFAKEAEIHAAQLRPGSRGWKPISEKKRHGLAHSLMRLVCNWQHDSTRTEVQPFVIVMDRDHSQSPLETSYGELLYLFDDFLRTGRKRGSPHNGVLIADRSRYEKTLHAWVESARVKRPPGRHSRPRLHALAETPFFVDSKTTRLMQLADLVAHAFYRAYNAGDWAWASALLPGVLPDPVRLVHFTDNKKCECPACKLATGEMASEVNPPDKSA